MFNFFRNLIKLPPDISEDDARTGAVLQNIILITFIFPIVIFAFSIYLSISLPNIATTLIQIGFSVILLLVILSFMVRRGLIRATSIILISGLLILAIYTNYLGGGAFNATFITTGAIILMSGLLLGTRGAIVTLLVIIVEETFLGRAGMSGMIKVEGELSPVMNYITAFTGYFISILIFQVSASSLFKQLEISRAREQKIRALSENLELRVQQRTAELDKRSRQLEAASLVARTIAEIHGQKEILETIVQQISARFGFYHAGIFLTDINGEYVVLEAASSEGGKKMIQRGHKLAIGRQGIIGFAAYQKRPHIAQNVGADVIFLGSPDLPETHSEMALPLLTRNRLVGILDLQSEEHNAFSGDDISTLQIMTDQIALALENARLLNESRSAIDELQTIATENISGTWRERLGQLRKGYSYSSAGISAISPTDEDAINNDSKMDEHVIKIPVALRGQRIGHLSLTRKPNESPWTETEQEMADKIAIQVALAIENARLLEESQRRALREQTVNDLSSRFSRSLDVDTLLQNAVRELHRIPQVSEVSVYIAPNEAIENQSRNTEAR